MSKYEGILRAGETYILKAWMLELDKDPERHNKINIYMCNDSDLDILLWSSM